MSWTDQAKCKGAQRVFYIGNGAGSARAREMCDTCPVKAECLADALAYERTVPAHLIFGYRAGLTASQRVDLMRGEGRTVRAVHATCGTDSGYCRHRRLGEPTCDACRAAHSDATYARTKKNGRKSRAKGVEAA